MELSVPGSPEVASLNTANAPRRPRSDLEKFLNPKEVSACAIWLFLQRLADHEDVLYRWIIWLSRRNLEPSDCNIRPKRLRGHNANISAIVYDKVERGLMVTSSFDAEVKLWDVSDPEAIHCKKSIHGHGQTQISALAISHDSKLLATGASDNRIRLWAMPSGAPRGVFHGHEGRVTSIKFTPDGNNLITSSWDETIRIWRIRDGHCLKELEEHGDMVSCVDINLDGTLMLSASEDFTIIVWKLPSCEVLHSLVSHKDVVNTALFSPCGQYIVSGSNDKSIKFWSVDDGELITTLEGWDIGLKKRNHLKRQLRIAKKELAQARSEEFDENAESEDMEDLREISAECAENVSRIEGEIINVDLMRGHDGEVAALCFSPDGFMLVSGGSDSEIRLWGMPHLTLLATLKGNTTQIASIAFSPDGTTMVVGSAEADATLWHGDRQKFFLRYY